MSVPQALKAPEGTEYRVQSTEYWALNPANSPAAILGIKKSQKSLPVAIHGGGAMLHCLPCRPLPAAKWSRAEVPSFSHRGPAHESNRRRVGFFLRSFSVR